MSRRSARSAVPAGGSEPTGRPPSAAWLAGALLLACTACAGPERTEPPVAEETYVQVMARLAAVRDAASPGGDAAPTLPRDRADSLRSEILREHGVGRSDLREFARVTGDEPKRMRALWRRIESVADSLRREGWPRDTGSRGGAPGDSADAGPALLDSARSGEEP